MTTPATVAQQYLARLREHGVRWLFGNAGTDFPPLIEAMAARPCGIEPILVPHENVAIAMAYGAALASGRPQLVMVHVGLGTANSLCGLFNAARQHVPIVLTAGRTPVLEHGRLGSRNNYINWAQEMFDQAGMLRELVKWDYELKVPEQAADVAARAYEMTMTSPRGPVYLVLPREPLAAPVSETLSSAPRQLPRLGHPDPQAIATLAEWIAQSQSPLIVTSSDGDPRAVAALSKLAEDFALPVVNHNPRVVTLPSGHSMHAGYDSGPLVPEADLIINAECDVPWYPHFDKMKTGCKVAHIGEDPVYQRYPMRSFPSDLSLVARSADVYMALHAALGKHRDRMKPAIEARRQHAAERRTARAEKAAKEAQGASDKITPAYLSHCIGEAFGSDAVIFNEYPLSLEHCPRNKADTFYSLGPAGGLGWGLGAAIGAKLAAPEKLIVATLGDGSYMFGNPTVSHWVQDKFKLPILAIVFNNSRYGAVRRATLSMFKDGVAGETDGRFLADLDPSPPFDQFVTAQGGHGERVERPEDVPAALIRALDAVRGGRQALLNMITPY